MKRLSFDRKALLRTLALAVLPCHYVLGQATTATNFTLTDSSGTTFSYTGAGTNTTSAYLKATGSGIYNVTINSGTTLGNTANALISVPIIGTLTNSGTVMTGEEGLLINGAVGTFTNSGTFTTGDQGLEVGSDLGTFTNSGSFTAGEEGLEITGNLNTFTNSASFNSGDLGVQVYGAVDNFTNSGNFISGEEGFESGAVGTFTNSGNFICGSEGISVGPLGAFTNSGTFSSESQGVFVNGGAGTITNSGTFTVHDVGVEVSSNLNSFTNSGTFTTGNEGVEAFGNLGSFTNSGIFSAVYQGVEIDGNVGTFTNSGNFTTSGQGLETDGSLGSFTNSGTFTTGNQGLEVDGNVGSFTNSGTFSTRGQGLEVDGNLGTFTNSGTFTTGNQGLEVDGNVVSFTNSGTFTAGSQGLEVGSLGSFTNTGTLNSGNQSLETDGDLGSFTNSGSITSQQYQVILISGNAGTMTNSGTIAGSTNNGVEVDGYLGNLTNSGTITGGTGSYSGIYVRQYANITLQGGSTVSGGTNSIYLNTSAATATNPTTGAASSTVTVNVFATLNGTIKEANNTGLLTLNLIAGTPAQRAIILADHGQTSGTVDFGGYTYTWSGLALAGDPISLELEVDPGLFDLAQKIDNAPLPYAGFAAFYTEAGANVEQAVETLSGRIITEGTRSIKINSDQAVLNGFSEQLENGMGSTGGFDLSGLSVSTYENMALNNTNSQLEALTDPKAGPTILAAEANKWGAWLSGNVTIGDDHKNAYDQPNYHAVNGSPSLGIDYLLGKDWKIGALASVAIDGADFSDGSRINTTTELLGLYTTYAPGSWRMHGVVAGGLGQYSSHRNVFGNDASGISDGYDLLSEGSVGYLFDLGGGYNLTPSAGIDYAHISETGYNEHGAGVFNLNVGDQNLDTLRTHLGAQFDKCFEINPNLKFLPTLRTAWYHEILDNAQTQTSQLAGDPALGSFSTQTSSPDRDFALVGVGLNTLFTGYNKTPVGAFLNYDLQVGQNNYIEHNVTAGVRISF